MVLKEIMAPAFVQLLAALAASHGPSPPGRDYFLLWPTTVPSPPFSLLVESFYKLAADQLVMYTAAGEGRWLRPVEAYYQDEACMR